MRRAWNSRRPSRMMSPCAKRTTSAVRRGEFINEEGASRHLGSHLDSHLGIFRIYGRASGLSN
eukprot:5293132-Pleurochrysis_carterae.AAC.3